MANILIERTLETGYEEKEYSVEDAVKILNNELENSRSIWIDNSLSSKSVIEEADLLKAKKVCVTNRLIGG